MDSDQAQTSKLEVQSKIVNLNDVATFTFSQPIRQHIIGVSGFYMIYHDESWHDVQTIAFSPSYKGGSDYSLEVQALGTLDSGNDDGVNVGLSNIVITVLAVTGPTSAGSNVETAVMVDGQSTSVQTEQSSSQASIVLLANAYWTYGTDHWIMKLNCDTSISPVGNTLQIAGGGQMQNEHGDVASDVAINAGIFYDASGIRTYKTSVQTIQSSSGGINSISYSDLGITSSDGWNGVYFLAGLDIFYPDQEDHHLTYLGAGGAPIAKSSSALTDNDLMVTFDDDAQEVQYNAFAYMNYGDDDNEDPSSSATYTFLFWKDA